MNYVLGEALLDWMLSVRRKAKIRRVMASVADTPELRAFWEEYSPRPPERDGEPHELIQLADDDGVMMLDYAPAQDVEFGKPRSTVARYDDDSINRYIWVIDRRGIPYIIEQSIPRLNDDKPKHTNLTGGGEAHIGGELWFADEESLFLSGGSGRYPPCDEIHLNDAVGVFKSYGYRVTSLGWDSNTGLARREYDGG